MKLNPKFFWFFIGVVLGLLFFPTPIELWEMGMKVRNCLGW